MQFKLDHLLARLAQPSTVLRLAALVPRPRLHLIRFHGVLAPNAKLRALVLDATIVNIALPTLAAQC